MTKLLIYRGNALHGEYELTGQTVHIGRSPQNDIVLEDPGKGVSRQHAEIRAEGGHYMLVDLESQNGIWVDGSRVPSVQLAPGVTAALGPFRLTTVEAAASAPPPAPAEFVTEPTEYSRPEERAASEAVDGAGALLDGPPPVPPPAAAPSPAPPAGGGTGTMRAGAPASSASSSAPLIAAAAAVIVLLGAGVGTYKWLHNRAARPVWDRDAAVALVNEGKCGQALQEQIAPALTANPNDADALALKDRCAPPPAPAPAPPPAPAAAPAPAEKTVAQKLDDVEASLAANQCQAALDAVNAVLTTSPDDARAKDLAAKADACLKPAAPATPEAPPPAVKIAAAQGGLDVQPGETQREYSRRNAAMKKRYEDAVALLQAQKYQQALKELDAVASVVPAGYLDLAQRRADARAGIKDDATRVYNTGKQAEQQGDLAAATQRYQHAHELDASIDVTADIARVNDQKLKLGRQACTTAKANFALGNNQEAAVQYQKVLDYLPETEQCYKDAKAALSQIKR